MKSVHRLIQGYVPRARIFRGYHASWLVALVLLLVGCGNAHTSTTARTTKTATTATATAAPAQHIYFSEQNGSSNTVMALNAADGSMAWTSAALPGYAARVALDGGTIYALATQGTLEALRATDGKEVWHVDELHNTLASLAVDVGTVFVGAYANSNSISAYRGSDGSLLWTKSGLGNRGLEFSAANGVVYVASGGSAIALRGSDGSVLWQKNVVTDVNSSLNEVAPAVASGMVFFFGYGDVYALNTADGSLQWHYAGVHAGCPCPANVSVGNGQVYAPEWNAIVALNATDGSLVRSTPLPGLGVWTNYASGIVYYWSDGHLYAMQASDGAAVWNVALQAGAVGGLAGPSPVISTAIFLSVNQAGYSPEVVPGNVYAIRPADGSTLWEFKGTTGWVADPVLG